MAPRPASMSSMPTARCSTCLPRSHVIVPRPARQGALHHYGDANLARRTVVADQGRLSFCVELGHPAIELLDHVAREGTEMNVERHDRHNMQERGRILGGGRFERIP